MTSATTLDETPVFLPCGDTTLFGILTEPCGDLRGIGVVVLSGGGTPLSTNVNRLSVRLCRRVSELGFSAFRFDYHGVGESAGASDRFHLAKPFVADVEGVLASLRAKGIDRFVLVGSCFGARSALATAAISLDVEGLVLISPPARDFEMGERIATRLPSELSFAGYARKALQWRNLRRIRHRRSRQQYSKVVREKFRAVMRRDATDAPAASRYRVSQTFTKQFRDVVRRGVEVLVIFGSDDDVREDFYRALINVDLDLAGAGVIERIIPGVVHGFSDLGCQEAVLEGIRRWLGERPTFRAGSQIAAAGRSEIEAIDPLEI
jgi:pimeloyl-ACP methyl ester carboxylesterase